MITVLWTMTVASVIALAAAVSGRTTVNAARNRAQSARALWIGLGCARRIEAAVDELLTDASTLDDGAQIWRTLDRQPRLTALAQLSACDARLEAAGTKLDVNAASDEMLASLLLAMGTDVDQAASMVDALDDWRDSDDVARPAGAERDWYANAQRQLPRNASLGGIGELAYVRGFEDLQRYDSVLTAEPGRVSLATAPVTVLRAIPGFTRETAELVADLHDAGTPVRDLLEMADQLSADSRGALLARYSDIARVATVDPDAWIVTIRASSGFPASTIVLTWRIARAGRRCVVVRTTTAL